MVKGYKVFNSDWTCRGKRYTCPGIFEEDVDIEICEKGMHFCKNLVDCFRYYRFDSENHVAEVIAHGDVIEEGDKCCTNKLEIVREISWDDVLRNVNIGNNNNGIGNTGDENEGGYNVGHYNYGNSNTGSYNKGNANTGFYNDGGYNTGNRNKGYYNSGVNNIGNCNLGDYNKGRDNIGSYNFGSKNIGDYNIANATHGCFNTQEQNLFFFNKPSIWTICDWETSEAKKSMDILISVIKPQVYTDWVDFEEEDNLMVTTGYLKNKRRNFTYDELVQIWWYHLRPSHREAIESIPNFDAGIFELITGVDVEAGKPERDEDFLNSLGDCPDEDSLPFN